MPATTPQAPELFEHLEERQLLFTSPFLLSLPTLDMMANEDNTVVRMQTSAGLIDIELYDHAGPAGASAAPITAANFLEYINSGRYDNTFFHRLESGFVLQGGGFTFTDADAPPRSFAIHTDPPIVNEFDAHRSNVEQTLAMAKLGGDPNSATSQFFFNLGDNSANLDNQNGGFTVFAKVIQGWSFVQAMAGAQVRDLDQFFTGSDPNPGLYDKVPVTGDADGDLMFITDIEVIKPEGSHQFFSQSIYFPDGFRSGRATDTIQLVNQDPNAPTPYEVIAHFESGIRDEVIFTNTLAPGAQVQIPLGGSAGITKVRAGTPYSVEIRAAHAIGATMHHKDFGAVAAEAFVQPDNFTLQQLTLWNFANGLKGNNNPSFLTWDNLRGQDVTVNILFYPDGGGTPFYIGVTSSAYRRGGLNISDTAGVPEGRFSILISASGPIVAALSQYSISPGQASTDTGVIGGGDTKGVLPGAYLTASGQGLVSALFSGTTPSLVTIDLDFILADGTVLHSPGAILLSPAIPRRDVDLIALNPSLPTDQFFTIRYHVSGDAAPVSLSYTSTVQGDTVSTAFQTFAAPNAIFAGGQTDPNQTDRDVISIYNPFSDPATVLTYRVTFHFAVAGREVVIPANGSGNLAGNHRVDLNVRDYTDIMQLITSDARFRHFSITVEGTLANGSTAIDGGFYSQLTYFSAGDNTTTGPTYVSGDTLVGASDSRFA